MVDDRYAPLATKMVLSRERGDGGIKCNDVVALLPKATRDVSIGSFATDQLNAGSGYAAGRSQDILLFAGRMFAEEKHVGGLLA